MATPSGSASMGSANGNLNRGWESAVFFKGSMSSATTPGCDSALGVERMTRAYVIDTQNEALGKARSPILKHSFPDTDTKQKSSRNP